MVVDPWFTALLSTEIRIRFAMEEETVHIGVFLLFLLFQSLLIPFQNLSPQLRLPKTLRNELTYLIIDRLFLHCMSILFFLMKVNSFQRNKVLRCLYFAVPHTNWRKAYKGEWGSKRKQSEARSAIDEKFCTHLFTCT